MSLEITIAAPFKHTRKDKLQKNDFIFYLALDRKWMSREQANILIERGIERGLIKHHDGWIIPLFDLSAITVPLGYKAPSTVFTGEDPYEVLIKRIVDNSRRSLNDITAELYQTIHEGFDGNLRIDAAAVVLAKKYNVPFEDLLDQLKEHIMKKK